MDKIQKLKFDFPQYIKVGTAGNDKTCLTPEDGHFVALWREKEISHTPPEATINTGDRKKLILLKRIYGHTGEVCQEASLLLGYAPAPTSSCIWRIAIRNSEQANLGD